MGPYFADFDSPQIWAFYGVLQKGPLYGRLYGPILARGLAAAHLVALNADSEPEIEAWWEAANAAGLIAWYSVAIQVMILNDPAALVCSCGASVFNAESHYG
jgi:hypothetical protein